MRRCEIVSTGIYMPENYINSNELDKKLSLPLGTIEKKSGIKGRYYIKDETNSFMAKKAIEMALSRANMDISQIDCIIDASGTYEQPLPSGGSIIARELGVEGITTFDIDTTCIGFISALDIGSYMLSRYKYILIVTSEIASVGLDYSHIESASLFGDGASATIITKGSGTSNILSSQMKTYSSGASFTEIRGGGSKYHPKNYSEENYKEFTFQMSGEKVYRLARKHLKDIEKNLFSEGNISLEQINHIIPHQASPLALKLMGKSLAWPSEKVHNHVSTYGNMISTSIPHTLHLGIEKGTINKGDKIYFIGTAAGLIIGGLILEY